MWMLIDKEVLKFYITLQQEFEITETLIQPMSFAQSHALSNLTL